jgi:hypothetical protein
MTYNIGWTDLYQIPYASEGDNIDFQSNPQPTEKAVAIPGQILHDRKMETQKCF